MMKALALLALLAGCIATGCLPSGTLIQTPAGSIPIESLAVGDEVRAWSPDGRCVHARVTAKRSYRARSFVEINLEGGFVLAATRSHPVRTTSGWVPIGQLAPGDLVATRSGEKRVIRRRLFRRDIEVHDIEVASTGTYFANGGLVHNKSILPPRWEDLAGERQGSSTDGDVLVILRLPDDERSSGPAPISVVRTPWKIHYLRFRSWELKSDVVRLEFEFVDDPAEVLALTGPAYRTGTLFLRFSAPLDHENSVLLWRPGTLDRRLRALRDKAKAADRK